MRRPVAGFRFRSPTLRVSPVAGRLRGCSGCSAATCSSSHGAGAGRSPSSGIVIDRKIGRLRAGRRPSRPLTPSGPSGYPRQPSRTTADAVSRPPTVSRWPPRLPCYVRPTRLDQAAGVRPTRCSGSYGVRSRSIAHATLSSRSDTVRSARPWRWPRPRSSPYRSRLAASCWIATRAQ